jgi:hypothetical protein
MVASSGSGLLGVVGSVAICLLLATIFVLSLYLCVPAHIQKLARDHPTHVRRVVYIFENSFSWRYISFCR